MAHPADQLIAAEIPAAGASRRLLGFIGAASLLLLAAWLRLGLVGGDWWPVQWLEVSGPFQRVSPEMIRGALKPALGRGYFALDMQALQRRVDELPWVAETKLRRRWPDTLEVVVVEHQPVAYWRDDAVISQRGEVFALQQQMFIQGLPRLHGPAAQKDLVVETWRQFQNRLDQAGLVLMEVHQSERGAWWLVLSNGARIDLGREEIIQRINRFIAAAPQLRLARGELPLRVDMRYSNGFAVVWPESPVVLEQVGENG